MVFGQQQQQQQQGFGQGGGFGRGNPSQTWGNKVCGNAYDLSPTFTIP
jgi:hypothetical protein